MKHFQRPIFKVLLTRLEEPRRFIQVLSGPRQVGKTTLVRQVMAALKIPNHYASADEPTLQASAWIEQQWNVARLLCQQHKSEALLVLDEVQKVPHWPVIVKRLWDEDTANKTPLKVVLLGSAPLVMQDGLTESLAGRFEVLHITHWSFTEMHTAFGWDLKQFIYFGGYPGAAELIGDENRWARYINDSLIETTISRDILLLTRVDKPALLRRLFQLGCYYSGQILSYHKMLGQLQDAGNTTTLSHYLRLLAGAGMITGLEKFSGKIIRQRASSPKLEVFNTALISAQATLTFKAAQQNHDYWGRLLESAVGAHLLNSTIGTKTAVLYWREDNKEVDFVLSRGQETTALEVKSTRAKDVLPGMEAFSETFKVKRKLLIGAQGMVLEDFFKTPAEELL